MSRSLFATLLLECCDSKHNMTIPIVRMTFMKEVAYLVMASFVYAHILKVILQRN